MPYKAKYVDIGKRWITNYFEDQRDYLCHYGIKGQKWGVRNGPPYPIKRNNLLNVPKSVNIKASNGVVVSSLSKHIIERINNRTIPIENIIDALRHPLDVGEIKTDNLGRKSQRFIGRYATVNVNPETHVAATVWRTGSYTIKAIERRKNNVQR